MANNLNISAQSEEKKTHKLEPHMSFSDQIASTLSRQIESGFFPVGSRLPSERELCAQFSVSRTVVREALSKLKSSGVIKPKAGSGVFVIKQDSSETFTVQNVSIHERRSREHIMELLIAFEVAAARIAAARRTDDDLKNIKRALVGMQYAILNDQLGDKEDYAFHEAIVNATHNPHFISLSKHLEFSAHNLIRQARKNTKMNLSAVMDDVQNEHVLIYECIKNSDIEGAAQAAENHLKNAATRIQIYLLGSE